MFGSLGVPEILFILVLALLVFGPRRLPELGRTIGRAMGEFRRASTELRRTLNNELALEDESPRRPLGASVPPVQPRVVAGPAAVVPPLPKPAAGNEPRGAAGEIEPGDSGGPPIPPPAAGAP